MTKPTLLQTLLNQPSRSYIDLNSPTQDFYTLKPQPPKRIRPRSYDGGNTSRRSSLRLSGSSFSATNTSLPDHLPSIPPTPPAKDDELMRIPPPPAESTMPAAKPVEPRMPRSKLAAAHPTTAVEQRPVSTASTASSLQDFYEAAERHSWAMSSTPSSSQSTTPRASFIDPLGDTSTSSPAPTLQPSPATSSSSLLSARRRNKPMKRQRKSRTEEDIIALQKELDEMGIMDVQDARRDSLRRGDALAEVAEEEDHDQFFTPPTSPPGSPDQTLVGKHYFPSLDLAAEEGNGYSSPTQTPRALRRRPPIASPSSPSKEKPAPIRSSASDESDSDFSSDDSFSNWRSSSSYARSLSTAPTSVSGFSASSPPKKSTTNTSPSKSTYPRPPSLTFSSSRGSSTKSHGRPADSTSADWAKGVKWLGAEDNAPKPAKRSWTHTRRSSVDLSTSASSASSIFDHPVVIDRSERRRSFDSSVSVSSSNDRWELNSKGPSSNSSGPTSAPPPSHHRRSNSVGASSSSGAGGGGGARRRHARARTSAAADAEMQKRMSAVLEVDDNGEVIGTSVGPASQHAYGSPRPPSFHGRPGARSSSRPQSFMSGSSSTSTYRTVELPSVPATTDGQVTYPNGFTSLTLPRAAESSEGKKAKRAPDLFSGHVDLARSGLAQVTMGTISVIKGAAASISPTSKPASGTLGRSASRLKRLSRSFTSSSSSSASKAKESETPARLQPGIDQALAFTTLTPTPTKYGPSQMIVKVFVAGVSDLDRLVVRNRVKGSKGDEAYGFVPGRAFVGKVIETGWEVNDVRSGDWVMGLTELSTSSSGKGGTLAEYVVVDRTRVSRAPKPGTILWPGARQGLTMEQIVGLPLVAVFAHRAVKTFPHAVVTMRRTVPSLTSPPASPRKTRVKGKGKEKEPERPAKLKVLVLGANTDVGDLVVQEFMLRDDLDVHVQVPDGADVLLWEGLENVHVVQGDNVENVLAGLQGEGYVMVVDCVGGEAVWKAARRVLDPRCGQFTTLVGDDPSLIPTRQAYTKSGLRSLKHAFIKSGGKTLGYEWVCPAVDVDTEGDDVRTNLVEIARMVEQGMIVPPTPKRVVMFERGMEAFKDGVDGLCAVRIAA